MKIKLTIDQMTKILKTEKPKFPITIYLKGLDKRKVNELVKVLKGRGQG